MVTLPRSDAGRVDHRPDLSGQRRLHASRSDPAPVVGRAPVRSSAHGDRRRRPRRARRARLPGRRGPRHRDLPRPPAAAPAAARGRGGRRQDRGGQGAGRAGPAASSCGSSATRASTPPRPSTSGTTRASCCTCGRSRPAGGEVVEDELYSERFLVRRPLLRAIAYEAEALGAVAPPVLLVDEVDRADDEFEAFLLEILSDYTITVPELGTFRAEVPPIVVVTSNRTRDVHDALKRRCLYHWIEHPDFERELAILRRARARGARALARQVAAAVEALRGLELYKPPGVAETIDWAQALAALGRAAHRRARGRRHARHHPQVPRGPGAHARARPRRELVQHRDGAQCLRRVDAEPRPASAVGFARLLRGAGPRRAASAAPSRSREALAAVGRRAARRRCTGRAGPRSCAAPRTSTLYDRAFAALVGARDHDSSLAASPTDQRDRRSRSTPTATTTPTPTTTDGATTTPDARGALQPGRGAAPPRLRARTRPTEFAEARRLMADLRLAGALRRSRRLRPSRAPRARPTCAARSAARCAPAASRSTARSSSRPTRPRRLVLLCDVSGSMEPYARALVRFLHAAVVGRGPGRGVRARHPAHPHHPRAVVARPRRRARRRRPAGRRLVGRHPPRRGRCASSTTSGACGAWPAARSS